MKRSKREMWRQPRCYLLDVAMLKAPAQCRSRKTSGSPSWTLCKSARMAALMGPLADRETKTKTTASTVAPRSSEGLALRNMRLQQDPRGWHWKAKAPLRRAAKLCRCGILKNESDEALAAVLPQTPAHSSALLGPLDATVHASTACP